MIDGHGDDLYRYGGRIKYNFSSNILQGLDLSALYRHLSVHMDVIANYPAPAPYDIEALLAHKLGIPADCVMVTNGAAEAIHIVARAHPAAVSAVLQPTFVEYADACRISLHTVKSFDDMESVPADADMVWLCNPNNPTGRTLDPDDLLKAVDERPDTVFVIDQAYHMYTRKPVIDPTEATRRTNLILLYSMTKDYAIPGLRLGFAVAHTSLIMQLRHYRIPWSVNAIAIEAARFMLSADATAIDIVSLLDEASRMSSELAAMGIEVMPSDTNFMLCRLPRGTASDLKEYLAAEHGILIRDASNFEGLSDRHFRIAVQTPLADDSLINALRLWMLS